jgi:hypothetical protein
MEAQGMASPNGNESTEERKINPSRPPRRHRDERVESEAQDILEQLKNL